AACPALWTAAGSVVGLCLPWAGHCPLPPLPRSLEPAWRRTPLIESAAGGAHHRYQSCTGENNARQSYASSTTNMTASKAIGPRLDDDGCRNDAARSGQTPWGANGVAAPF